MVLVAPVIDGAIRPGETLEGYRDRMLALSRDLAEGDGPLEDWLDAALMHAIAATTVDTIATFVTSAAVSSSDVELSG